MLLFVFYAFSKKNPFAPPQARVNLSRALFQEIIINQIKMSFYFRLFALFFLLCIFLLKKMVIQKAKKIQSPSKNLHSTYFSKKQK